MRGRVRTRELPLIGERSDMSAAMSVPYPILLGHIADGIEISVASEARQEDLSLTALVNGVLAGFKPFHKQGLRLDQSSFNEGTNELLVLAMLRPGADAQQTVIEFRDVATQSVDRFIVTPVPDSPDVIEVLVDR